MLRLIAHDAGRSEWPVSAHTDEYLRQQRWSLTVPFLSFLGVAPTAAMR